MDINPGANDSTPAKFTVAGTNLFFKADNGTATNLWRTFSGVTQKVTDPIVVTVPATSTFASIGSTLCFVGTSRAAPASLRATAQRSLRCRSPSA